MARWMYVSTLVYGNQWCSYRLPIRDGDINNYEHLMSTDGEYAGHVKLECISWLNPDVLHFVCIN